MYDTFNLTSTDIHWIQADKGITHCFTFLPVSGAAVYVHCSPSPGSYVLRLGVY